MRHRLPAAIAIAVLATVAAPAVVSAGPVDCTASGFAVGGYPTQERVPDGYTAVATPGGIFASDAGGYNVGQRVGAANVVATVDAFATACPNTDIRLFGHSYGAAIIHTAVETIDTRAYAGRVHVQLTGNPRHPGGIEDTYKGRTILPGVTMRGAGKTPTNVASYESRCQRNDGICDHPRFLTNPVGHLAGLIGYGSTGAHRYK